MDAAELADRLLAARDQRSRRRLILETPLSIDIETARRLISVCVENWASNPKVTQDSARVLHEIASEFPSTEILAYSAWADGISEMTRGRVRSAIESLRTSTAKFVKAGKTVESAQPQIAALVALAMLGSYARALAVGRRALRILSDANDQLSAGKVEINLANIAFQLGRYKQAEIQGLSAYSRFRRLKVPSWRAMAENGLANTYVALNDYRSAVRYFRLALDSARSTGKLVTEAEIEASIGNLELSRGRFAEALRSFELSRQKFDELNIPHKSAIADLEIAEIYAELNLSAESMELLSKVVVKFAKLKMQSEEARARLVLGKTAIRQRIPSLARKELQKSSRLYKLEKNRHKQAVVMVYQALLELRENNFDAAREFAGKANRILKKAGNERELMMPAWIVGEVLINTGNPRRGLSSLRKTLSDSKRLEQVQVALLSLNSIGMAHLRLDDRTAAKRSFNQAIALTEKSRAPLPGEEFRIAFLDGKMEPFEQMARIKLSENKVAEAMGYVEMAKSRSLLERMNDCFDTATSSTGASARASQLREELNWFYSRSRVAPDEEAAKIQLAVRTRERKLSDVIRREQSLNKTESLQPATGKFDIEKLRDALGPDRALIEYINFNGTLSAFVVTSESITFRADLTTEYAVAKELEDLRFQFGSMRYGRQAVSSFGDQLIQRTDAVLSRLYKMLVEPVEQDLGERNLIVIPAGTVHYVPFSALRDNSGYLIQSRTVSTAPSASIWEALTRRPAVTFRKPLLIAFADNSAPEVENEVQAISETLPSARVFSGERATFSNFSKNAGRHDMMHIACHGRFRADSPLNSSLQLADGLITVRDISAQKLNAGLAVLSACETGLNKLFPGEEIVGLARGFISAGVRSLVLSLWTVNDEATKRFMIAFYGSLVMGASVEASLRQAQSTFIEQGEHPYYWSPFFAVG